MFVAISEGDRGRSSWPADTVAVGSLVGRGTPIAGIGTPHGISTSETKLLWPVKSRMTTKYFCRPHGIGTPGIGTRSMQKWTFEISVFSWKSSLIFLTKHLYTFSDFPNRTPHGITTPLGVGSAGCGEFLGIFFSIFHHVSGVWNATSRGPGWWFCHRFQAMWLALVQGHLGLELLEWAHQLVALAHLLLVVSTRCWAEKTFVFFGWLTSIKGWVDSKFDFLQRWGQFFCWRMRPVGGIATPVGWLPDNRSFTEVFVDRFLQVALPPQLVALRPLWAELPLEERS